MPKLPFQNCMKNYFTTACLSILSAILAAIMPANGLAQPVATPPYSVATFAVAPTGLSKPDSVTFSSTNVFVGYGNGGAPDGSGGAMSNIIEYDFKGNVINNFTVVGHNDGLRFNPIVGFSPNPPFGPNPNPPFSPMGNDLWALQNEDGNANLVILDLQTGQQTVYQLGTGPHGGGYDDIDFNNSMVYLSASAPTINPNTAPAIVSLNLVGGTVLLTGILNGNA